MLDLTQSRYRVLAAIATVWLLGVMGVFIFIAATRPEPAVVTHWATGHLMREGKTPDGENLRLLPVMVEEFNRAGHSTKSGKPIKVEVHNVPSKLIADYLLARGTTGVKIDLHDLTNGYVDRETSNTDPTIVTPSSAHWLVSANHAANQELVDLANAQSIVRPVIGIVTYEEMARCLGWPEKEIGYADIMALRDDPEGWASYSCARAEWGKRPLVAFTDPVTSSTGRSLLFALYSFATGKAPEQLTVDDISRPEVVDYVKRFQGLIDHYQIGTTVLNTKIYQGPRYGHFFIMPEDNLIHLYEGTESAYINGFKVTAPPISERMVMIYPREGSMPRNNCACIVQADWVTPEQQEAAQIWIDYLRGDGQQRSFMAAGFRPGTDISLTDPSSKISAEFGLDPTRPNKVLNPSLIHPGVAAKIDEEWDEVKRTGIVTFVVDTSGSMKGEKLAQAKDGLIKAVDAMAKNNRVGLVTFNDRVDTRIPVASLSANRFGIADAAENLRARGGTGLYDAIKAGIEMTDNAPGDPDAIRGVVVLTDGQANEGETQLDHLIAMESRNEVGIARCASFDCTGAVDAQGGRVSKADIIGMKLALPTKHPIQIFFIGIGEDADTEVGRIMSEATGADFQGVAEDDLAEVMEEFSKYF